MAANEMVEVCRVADEMAAQAAVDEILSPAGIEAQIHNRTSHAFPAPASMPGAYFVAVPADRLKEAIVALREAQTAGVLVDDAVIRTA